MFLNPPNVLAEKEPYFSICQDYKDKSFHGDESRDSGHRQVIIGKFSRIFTLTHTLEKKNEKMNKTFYDLKIKITKSNEK